MAKITDRQIAKEFGTTTQSLYNWKNGEEPLRKRYKALKDALSKQEVQGEIIWKVRLRNGTQEIVSDSLIGEYIVENKDQIVCLWMDEGVVYDDNDK